jgi:hypothetical protein
MSNQKTIKTIKVIEDIDSDRIIILHIDNARWQEYADGIIGINFHQDALNKELYKDFIEPNIHLTEIWRRLTLNYPNVPYDYLIKQAIELYISAFISQPLN